MSSLTIGLISAGTILAGSVLGIGLQRLLPGHHLGKETAGRRQTERQDDRHARRARTRPARQLRQVLLRDDEYQHRAGQHEDHPPGSDARPLRTGVQTIQEIDEALGKGTLFRLLFDRPQERARDA